MRGLYIAPVDFNLKEHIGITTKMIGQISAFKELNVDMDYAAINDDYIVINNSRSNYKLIRAKHYMFFRYILKNKGKLKEKYDFVYLRFSFANPYMFKVAKLFKNDGAKVFIEIPTYPYYDELDKNIKNKSLKVVDRVLWNIYKKHIDRVILTNDLNSVFGVRAINIFNGIDVKKLVSKAHIDKKNSNINIVAVANLNIWHGYDRLIKGLYDYYSDEVKEKVHLYLIGEGVEKENLINLSKTLALDKYVHFLGAKRGKELDEVFSAMDIGASSLALFRAGGGHDPIKSKEYVGRGIPVILGYEDRALSNELDFVFKVPSDNTNIDIKFLIKKYNEMKSSADDIRLYAEKNLSWVSQMRKVIEWIIKN